MMCGIVGYLGKNNAVEVVLKGLKNLEYRGYDSAGIAYEIEKRIEVIKDKGRVLELENKINLSTFSHLAIGHTRWATHGMPSQANSHPHYSLSKRFIIVHNGIIENHQILKYKYFADKQFFSETDTEVIVNLIEYFSNNLSVTEAIRKTMSILEGSYACLLLDVYDLSKIYFFKDKSPLLVGMGKEGVCLASDLTGLVGYAHKYLSVEDKFLGVAYAKAILYYDMLGFIKSVKYKKISIELEEMDKKAYEHYMLKEIHEQPLMIRNLIHHYFDKEDSISPKLIQKIKKADKLNFVACGTSMYAAYQAKYFFEKLCNIPCEVFCASELVYSTPLISKRPLFIFLSQSGETADLIAVIKKVKKQKYPTLTITNTMESTMVRLSNYALDIMAGREIAVASTKAYTGMVVVCAILARATSGANTNLKNNLKGVIYAIEKVLNNKEACALVAQKIMNSPDAFYIGRGLDYWVCLEAALKLKEISYIHTEAFSSGELKHGPIALINKGTPVIAIITQEGTNQITRSNLEETISRGSKGIIISSKSLSLPTDDVIIPNVAHYLTPIVTASVVQLIAYYTAVFKGNDVDKPKNLAKSVTVE